MDLSGVAKNELRGADGERRVEEGDDGFCTGNFSPRREPREAAPLIARRESAIRLVRHLISPNRANLRDIFV